MKTNQDCSIIGHFIKTILSIVRSNLNEEAVQEIEHYLNYGEYEMAFEALYLSIMELGPIPKIDFKESMDVAKKLKLDEESVFDARFWDKFQKYISNQVTK